MGLFIDIIASASTSTDCSFIRSLDGPINPVYILAVEITSSSRGHTMEDFRPLPSKPIATTGSLQASTVTLPETPGSALLATVTSAVMAEAVFSASFSW